MMSQILLNQCILASKTYTYARKARCRIQQTMADLLLNENVPMTEETREKLEGALNSTSSITLPPTHTLTTSLK